MTSRYIGNGMLVALLAVVLVVYAGILYASFAADPTITGENGIMENLQACSLALACLVLLPCFLRTSAAVSRFGCWVLLLFFLALLLREVDVERLSWSSEALVSVASGTGRNILLGGAFLGTWVAFAMKWRERLPEMLSFMKRIGLLFAAGCLLYLSSWPFDKSLFPLTESMRGFCEEGVECGATLCFFLASLHVVATYFKSIVNAGTRDSGRVAAAVVPVNEL